MRLHVTLLLLSAAPFAAWAEDKTINPRVTQIVEAVSEERIGEILKKLESFGTRNIFSSQDDPASGIGAARRWIYDQSRGYSPRLQVRYDTWRVKKKGRIIRDVELHNVVAVLPGTMNKDRYIIVSGHYDSAVMARRPQNATPTGPPTDGAAPDPASSDGSPPGGTATFDLTSKAPRPKDDASGT